MAQSASGARFRANVLQKVFDLSPRGMSSALAQSILELDFPEAEAQRIEELNAKANDGSLSAEEQAELEAYIDVSDLLAYWQSKARTVLDRPA